MTTPWLESVRLRAERHMLWSRELWQRSRYAGEETLAITHSEVERALVTPERHRDDQLEYYASDEAAAALSAEIERLERAGEDTRWRKLTALCELSPAESALLACALAAEARPALRRVFGYLQDEVAPIDATPALAAALWQLPAVPRLGAGSQLVRWRLARPVDPERDPESSAAQWVADPRLLEYLLGERAPSVRTPVAMRPAPKLVLFKDELAQITTFARTMAAGRSGPVEIELAASPGTGKATLAAQVARALRKPLVSVECAAIAGLSDPATAAVRELRYARLHGAVVLWQHADALPAPAQQAITGRAPLSLLTTMSPIVRSPAGPALRRTYELAPIDRARRLALWAAVAEGPAPTPVAEWTLSAAEVIAAADAARAGQEAVRAVLTRMLLRTPSELVTPLKLPYAWDDLVASDELAKHLRELEAQCRARVQVLDGWGLRRLVPLGRGVTALFAGPSGTGKTMAAQVIARELGLELLRVDLAGVVNKYIGETEKHLRAVFAACERAPVLLFFDEADALFGRRMQVSDAHDRFANIEVDYLLQRMEEFDGVAVLATNRKGDIDPAFLRRLRFVIDFAQPTVDERERLWRAALESARDADGEPLAEELDWPALARGLDLTGAGIKSSAVAAAFLAHAEGTRIGTRHIVHAARRELQKQGVVVRVGQLEPAGVVQQLVTGVRRT